MNGLGLRKIHAAPGPSRPARSHLSSVNLATARSSSDKVASASAGYNPGTGEVLCKPSRTIVLTGGGSGGHITPILAVAAALKKQDKSLRLIYIGQKGDSLSDVPAADPNFDAVHTVRAGKFRRYSDEGWRQLLDWRTQALNLRDLFWIAIGLWQSFWLLRGLKPDIIFTRGGFVSVPVALGGWLNGVPFITHDSDSVPSLANKLIAPFALLHAVALPAEVYPYKSSKIEVVGVPVSHHFEPVNQRLQRHYRKLLEIDKYELVLLITGGGNGASKLNAQVAANAQALLKRFPRLVILHIAGRRDLEATEQAYHQHLSAEEMQRVQIEGFVTDMYRYSGAADLVIARGGATNLAELAVQGRACLVIPSPQLGWNVKNAEVMARHQAIAVLTDAQADQELRLASVVGDWLADEPGRAVLERNFRKLAHPDSAQLLAELLIRQINDSRSGDHEEG